MLMRPKVSMAGNVRSGINGCPCQTLEKDGFNFLKKGYLHDLINKVICCFEAFNIPTLISPEVAWEAWTGQAPMPTNAVGEDGGARATEAQAAVDGGEP